MIELIEVIVGITWVSSIVTSETGNVDVLNEIELVQSLAPRSTTVYDSFVTVIIFEKLRLLS